MKMREVARLHQSALPHTFNSRLGVKWLTWLYTLVAKVGSVETVVREHKIVGAMGRVGSVVVTLVVHPEWQRRGIGRELLARVEGVSYVYTENCTVGFYEKMGYTQKGKMGEITWMKRES